MTSPASIVYSGGAIKFHAVVKEEHEAITQVTTYPTQAGFDIADHAIKKNRVIKLSGIFSDTLLEGSNTTSYSAISNTKEMFKVLQSLVQSSEPVVVNTNLGRYSPIVFNSFKSEQALGTLDSLKFDMIGTEVQVANEAVKTAVVPITMVKVSVRDRDDTIKLLAKSGIVVDPEKEIYTGVYKNNENFSVKVKDDSGKERTATYKKDGAGHIVHMSETATYTKNEVVTKTVEVNDKEATTTVYDKYGRIITVTKGNVVYNSTEFGLKEKTVFGHAITKNHVRPGISELDTGKSIDQLYTVMVKEDDTDLTGVEKTDAELKLDSLFKSLEPEAKEIVKVIKVEGATGPLNKLTNTNRRI